MEFYTGWGSIGVYPKEKPSQKLWQSLLNLAGIPSFEGIGEGLKDMFTNAITSTKCFKVFDRDAVEAIQKELALVGKQLKAQSADYIALASVTSINFERKGGNLGLGIIPILSAISVQKQTAQLAMD
ncbi:MAG: CsgG/HfaB family protein, partial [Aquificaceae bacterium]